MSTAQMTRPQQQAGTWTNIFPAEQVTEQQSALFVKKLLAVAVSNVTYLRAIFPEYAFGDRCLEDLNLKILRDDSSCPGACQVIKWVKGCFDALEKKYLKMLIIGIYTNPDDPDTVIESYTFKFSYDQNTGVDIYRNNKRISSAFSAAETKKATIRLLRTIVVLTQSLASLPDNVMMTMKLLYYDDITPCDYEPPGFTAADTENFNFEEEPMNIKVGDVQTPFHTVKLRIKTDGKQFSTADGPEQAATEEGENPIRREQTVTDSGLDGEDGETHAQLGDLESECHSQMSQRSDVSNNRTGSDHNQVVPEPIEGDVPSEDTPAKPCIGDEAVDTAGSQLGSQTPTVNGSPEDLGVRCPCGCNEDDGLMILCAACKFWQHGVCFKILQEEDAPLRHICNLCGNDSDATLQPTDPNLIGLTDVAVQATCLWRRALLACTDMTRVLGPGFARRMGVEMTVGQGLINRMVKEGVLKNPVKGKKLGKIVEKEALREAISKYFKKPQKDTSVQEKEDEDTAMDVEVEIVEKSKQEHKKLSKGKKDVEMEIEQLASRADDINLSGHRKKGSQPKCQNKDMEMPKSNERGRGKKRVKAMTEENLEFELCNSQEVSQDIDYNSSRSQRKRRKASVARKAILV